MAIADAYNATGQAAQIAQNMFSPATNVLSNALNNAVDAGRRMVDLQSHQEDIFLSEREKLRLATERKGLEARRIFENDRNFGEDVLRDRRNFDEGVRRDDRNFGLESQYKMGMLGIQQSELGLRGDELGLRQQDFLLKEQDSLERSELTRSEVALNNARAASGGFGGYGSRYGSKPNAAALATDQFLREHGEFPSGDPLVLPTNPSRPLTGADREVAAADAARRKAFDRFRTFPQREMRAAIPYLPDNQRRQVLNVLDRFAPDHTPRQTVPFTSDFSLDGTGFGDPNAIYTDDTGVLPPIGSIP